MSKPFLICFVFLDVAAILKDKPICHLFHWIARPTLNALCHHCDRIMHGQTMEDVIFQRPQPSLDEDAIVQFVRGEDPLGAWDDFTLRMTLRINRYLRFNPPNDTVPDLAILNLF